MHPGFVSCILRDESFTWDNPNNATLSSCCLPCTEKGTISYVVRLQILIYIKCNQPFVLCTVYCVEYAS